MTLQEILSQLGAGGIGVLVLIFLTLVEVTPIKINPWSVLLKWIGRKTNAELYSKVDALSAEMETFKKDFENKNANDLRWSILGFASSCRKGDRHSREEWKHVVDQMAFYEEYVKKKNITNGVIKEDTKYLRNLYHKINSENDFD